MAAQNGKDLLVKIDMTSHFKTDLPVRRMAQAVRTHSTK